MAFLPFWIRNIDSIGIFVYVTHAPSPDTMASWRLEAPGFKTWWALFSADDDSNAAPLSEIK